MSEIVEVQLAQVVIQERGSEQYLHLQEKEGSRTFAIVIGYNEVWEISQKLHGIENARPLTHDLVTRILRAVGWTLRRVIISDLRDTTFFATLELESDDEEQKFVDCRPSDGIALAVQTGAQIFVARKVLDVVAHD